MRIRRENTSNCISATLGAVGAVLVFLSFSCDENLDSPNSKEPSHDSNMSEVYPQGEYEFLDANPLSPGFDQMFKLKDFQGVYTFWSVGCPL